MPERDREYRLYLIGCERLGQQPLDPEAFTARWQEFEDHAERLKEAEASGQAPDIDNDRRAEMQKAIKDDPFVKAVLVGAAEAGDMAP